MERLPKMTTENDFIYVHDGKNFTKDEIIKERSISLSVTGVDSWFIKTGEKENGSIFEVAFNHPDDGNKKLIVARCDFPATVNTYLMAESFSFSNLDEVQKRKFATNPLKVSFVDRSSVNALSLKKDDALCTELSKKFVTNIKCCKYNGGYFLAILGNKNVEFYLSTLEKSIKKTVPLLSGPVTEQNLLAFREKDFYSLETGSSVNDEILALKIKSIFNA